MDPKTQNFIDKAKAIHGDKYDYSKSKYVNYDTKTIIICKIHGEFWQAAGAHLQRQGCKKCGFITNRRSSNAADFIAACKAIHGDKYDYSKVVYTQKDKKVTIICKDHGEFTQVANSHKRGSGCKLCSFSKYRNTNKLTTDSFISKCNEVHGNRYDYSRVVYTVGRNKIIIICRIHGEFTQIARNHLNLKHGCSKCGNQNGSSKQRLSLDEFLANAKAIHGDKYDYSKSKYVNCDTKLTIICLLHGEFKQTPNDHINRKCGCTKCSNIATANINRSSTDEFIRRAKEIHGDRYDYSKVNYINTTTKITIICKTHGAFNQPPGCHLRGNHCSKCAGCAKLDSEEFIRRAKAKHGNQYDYSRVDYLSLREKVKIICIKHGEFEQSPSKHTVDGNGCPKCACVGYSKAQIDWLNLLEQIRNIKIQHIGNSTQEYRIRNTRWKADGYCKETNTIFEFHGDYWHGNPTRYDPEFVNKVCNKKMKTLYANTLKREQRIKELGYNLEVMWESDWIKINKRIILLQRAFRSK